MKEKTFKIAGPMFDRRGALRLMGGSALSIGAGLGGGMAWANEDEILRSHGYSFFGDLAYPADFPHFAYVNPNAPKGGTITLSTRGTFDGFNRYSWKGGNPESSAGVVAESMFAEMPWGGGAPADSITDSYCLIAKELEYPKSQEWCVFHMRDDVVFSDGSPLRAQDAAFTHNLFLEQAIRSYARSVKERITGVEVIDDHTLKYTFAEGISRRSLISQVGGTPIFSEAWYKETGERLDEPSTLAPMASGPYQVGDYEFNRYVEYVRNPNYWGWDHPANVGRFNFDKVRIEYFTDATAEFEAFKAGEFTYRTEGSTKRWATGYDFPGIQNGTVKKEALPSGSAPTNFGMIYNTLRAPLDNRDVRHALSLAFNFEWVRESLQYELTTQRSSYAEGQEWEAKGVPEGAELALLKSLGDAVPPEMLTEPAVVPHTSNPSNPIDRRNKRAALKLFEKAGWSVNDAGQMVDGDGKQMSLDCLVIATWDETRLALIETYVKTLANWGIEVKADKVDSAQAQQRWIDKDYDMIYNRYRSFAAAGTGLHQMFGSKTAEVSTYNPAALRSPAVDAIIDAALATTTREDEVVALTALDRALRYERILAHAGYVGESWVSYFDMFERPEELPPYAVGVLDFWWYNKDKHEALIASGALRK